MLRLLHNAFCGSIRGFSTKRYQKKHCQVSYYVQCCKNGLNEGCVFEPYFGGYMAFSILSYILSTAQIYKLSTTFVGLIFRSFKGDKKHVTSSFLSKQIALLKENRDWRCLCRCWIFQSLVQWNFSWGMENVKCLEEN